MSVTLTSDLLVGVMSAASPARARAAATKLAGLPASDGIPAPSFQQALAASAKATGDDLIMGVLGAAEPEKLTRVEAKLAALGGEPPAKAANSDAFRGFESAMLRNMMESILPPAESGVFGEGYAGSMWRSMAADQFASLYADHGGIGIASMVSHAAATRDLQPYIEASSQWPYFAAQQITSYSA